MIVDAVVVAPNVELHIYSPPAGVTSWRATATTPEGSYVLRGQPTTGLVWVDAQAPLSDPAAGISRPITYDVTAFTPTGAVHVTDVSGPVVYPGARLTDSERPGVGMDVVVESMTPAEWQPRSLFYDVIGRADPVVAIQNARLRQGTVTFLTDDQADRQALLELVRGGAPLLLRTTNPDRAPDTMFVPTRAAAEERIDLTARRRWTLEYQSIALDQGAYTPPPVRTYATALADPRFPSYLSLFSYESADDVAFGTYDAYRAGV